LRKKSQPADIAEDIVSEASVDDVDGSIEAECDGSESREFQS
jgi:hypothetical protein